MKFKGIPVRALISGDVDWASYPFIPEFDSDWSDRWALKCERMCDKFEVYNPDIADKGYGSIYKLCEMLWKLKVWKP